MAKGGARGRSGPPPDPSAVRRGSRRTDVVVLPAEGRTGPVPPWPIPASTERELTVWAELWRRPQAVEWERLAHGHLVALYVRQLVLAADPEATAARLTVVRQFADTLGVTLAGLRANRWAIGGDDADAPKPQPARMSSRRRLLLIDDVDQQPHIPETGGDP